MSKLDPEEWSEVKRVFEGAADLPALERQQYLDRECPDDNLRREVASLLEYSGEELVSAHAAILSAAAALAKDSNPDSRLIGSRLGPYRVDALAGHGGMGAVYRASRADAEFRQEVAIKLVRVAAESPTTLRRFRQERQILAQLSHPNIARLLDGGSTPEGVPYLVMELIEGEPLTTWCDRQSLGIPERLRIFLKVCDGVEFAHSQGVVHRDLKPANILVTKDGTPKLLDFGIAKLLDGPAGHREAATLTGARVMTPEYASPEQVRGEPASLAADLYSLGLILYELLTGTKAQPMDAHTPDALVTVVCQKNPTAPALVNKQLAGDLDNIIRMAIRKEPDRRYPSVGLFAEDIQQHLDGHMVVASPDTLAYRSAKFLRRNRIAVAAVILIAGTAASGLALEYWLGAFARSPHVSQVIQLTETGRVQVGSGVVTDGAQVYFKQTSNGEESLFHVSVQGGTPQPLTLTPALDFPDILDISPDHSQLLLGVNKTADDKSLWVAPAQGGPAHRVVDGAGMAGAWSPDGKKIVFPRGQALYRIDADGANLRKVIDIPNKVVGDIRWAPGADSHVLRLCLMPTATWVGSLWEVTSEGVGLHPLLREWTYGKGHPDGDYNGNWIPSGKYFLFRSRRGPVSSVWAIHEKASWLPGFAPRPVQIYSGPLDFNPLASSPDGKRVFFAGGQARQELVRYEARRGEFMPYLSGIAGRWVDYSPDRRWVAYTLTPGNTLWRARPDGSERIQLVTAALRIHQPRWSPDGKWIAFDASQPGKPRGKVYVASTTPSGTSSENAAPESISPDNVIESEPSWSPDGKFLLFRRESTRGMPGEPGLYVMTRGNREVKLLPGSDKMSRAAWSPDPRYLAATDSAALEMFLFDFQTRRWTPLASGMSLGSPYWSRDGRYVYYQDVISSRQPIFRVKISDRKVERIMDSRAIPQSNVTGYGLAGLAPGDEPIATVTRSNSDLYALDVDLP